VATRPDRGKDPVPEAPRPPALLREHFALPRGELALHDPPGGWTNATVLLKVYSKWIEEAADASSEARNTVTPRIIEPGELAV